MPLPPGPPPPAHRGNRASFVSVRSREVSNAQGQGAGTPWLASMYGVVRRWRQKTPNQKCPLFVYIWVFTLNR